MILGQLIQSGRRFCECRSHDFIPESDDRIVVLAYSISDRFIAHSFEAESPDTLEQINTCLKAYEAIAYIIISRHIKNMQNELPAPIGRIPMDRITITAATPEMMSSWVFLMEKVEKLDNYKLIISNHPPLKKKHVQQNLFHYQTTSLRSNTDDESGLLPLMRN